MSTDPWGEVPKPGSPEAAEAAARRRKARRASTFGLDLATGSGQVSGAPSTTRKSSDTAESSDTWTPPSLAVRRALDLKPGRPTRWLAQGLPIPYGALTVATGDEGIGKSALVALLVAHVTTGLASRVLGIPERKPADVLLVVTEDPWPEVRTRLEAAGADLDRVHVVSEDDEGNGSPTFPRDMYLVARAAEAIEAQDRHLALVVVDAWLDTVEGGLRVSDPQQARRALHPWSQVAARLDAAVVLVTHTNRLDTPDVRTKVGASAALRQKARSLLFAAAPPDTEGRLYVGSDKVNHTGRRTAVEFRLATMQARSETPDDPGTTVRLRAVGDTGRTMQEHLTAWAREAREAERAAKRPTADERAEAWLTTFLYADGRNGEELAETTKLAAKGVNVSPDRLPGVVKGMGGFVGPEGKGGAWVYRLPPRQESEESEGLLHDSVTVG